MSTEVNAPPLLDAPDVLNDPDVGPATHLMDGLDINELMENGTTFEVHPDDLYDESLRENTFGDELLSANYFRDCFEDVLYTDDDDDLTPYERLANLMTDIEERGYVKKRILQEGNGQKIPPDALVTIHYDGFFEYQDEPYDSTLNKYPRSYRMGAGGLIPGMELAILSMEDRETAQFLVHPALAYGRLGCPDRIPANATLMFRIEIIRVVDSITADKYEKMTSEERKKFANVRKIAETHQTKAKESFRSGNYKAALKSYNTAIHLLETAQLANISEQEIQQKTLLKLYTNLAVCYNSKDLPKRACLACQRIYELTTNRELKVPAKAYFHHGRALIKLGEYTHAKAKLLKAKMLEPNNAEILGALVKLEELLNDYKEKEFKFAQAVADKKEPMEILDISDINPAFATKCKEFITNFKESKELIQELPDGLTAKELKLMQIEAEIAKMEFSNYKNNGKIIYTITKK